MPDSMPAMPIISSITGRGVGKKPGNFMPISSRSMALMGSALAALPRYCRNSRRAARRLGRLVKPMALRRSYVSYFHLIVSQTGLPRSITFWASSFTSSISESERSVTACPSFSFMRIFATRSASSFAPGISRPLSTSCWSVLLSRYGYGMRAASIISAVGPPASVFSRSMVPSFLANIQ